MSAVEEVTYCGTRLRVYKEPRGEEIKEDESILEDRRKWMYLLVVGRQKISFTLSFSLLKSRTSCIPTPKTNGSQELYIVSCQ